MSSKKKPLDDARKQLQEKLNNVEEQSEYMCQFIKDMVNEASTPAKKLLKEKDRKTFFQKYSSVSQELEKCLDCLLLMSDSMTALGEEDTQDEIVSESKPDKETNQNLKAAKSKQNEFEKEDSKVVRREEHSKGDTDDVLNFSEGKEITVSTEQGSLESSQPASSSSVSPTKELPGPKNDVVNSPKDLQSADTPTANARICSDKTEPANCNSNVLSNEAQNSQEGINVISSLIDVEPIKQCVNQSPTEDMVLARVQKSSKRRGSASSTGALSDIIQDIRISTREAKMAADTTPSKVRLVSYPFKNGQKLDVIITEVVSPWELWVQPIGTQLDLLMEEMCMHYARLGAAGYKGSLAIAPAKGDFCCAKFSEDDTWYRVQVIAVDESQTGSIVSVVSVDDGNRDKVGLSRLRPLEEKFTKLPCQGLCCALSGVRPIKPTPQKTPGVTSSLWSQESIDWLRKTVGGKQLQAYPIKTNDLIIVDLYASPPKSPKQKHQSVVKGLPSLHYSITEMMINVGMAQRIVSAIANNENSMSTTSSKPLSVPKKNSLTQSVSSVSIESKIEEETCSKNDKKAGDCAGTGNLISSTDTVVQCPTIGSENSGPVVKDHTLLGRDNMFQEGRLEDGEQEKMSGGDCKNLIKLQHVVHDSDTYLQSCKSDNSYQPQVGDYCCARFSEDGRWYRGLVTNFRRVQEEKKGPPNGESVDFQVFHLDFKSSEWVSPENVKQLEARFLSLPGQVVRYRLANLKPEKSEDLSSTSEQKTSPQPPAIDSNSAPSEEKQHLEEKAKVSFEPVSDTSAVSSAIGKPRKKDRRKRKRPPKINLKDQIIRAAGDESCDSSELSEFEVSKSKVDDSKKDKQDKSEEKDLQKDGATFPEKYLLPSPSVSPEKTFLLPTSSPEVNHSDEWASGSSELLSGLTDDNRKLVGYMVPWDPWMYQQLFYPKTTGNDRADITFKKPVLNLNLYDTTGEEDIFINQVLVDTGIAVFVEDSQEQTAAETMTVRFSLEDLQNTACSTEEQGAATVDPANFHSLTSPTSPISPLRDWDPMQEDFHSSKNTYSVNTDDLDIAFQGYQDLSRRVCRFFQTRSGCWRGDQCPNLHLKKGEEVHELVEVFCDNMDSSVPLPDIGTWVAVRVTAVFNPGHFWVQFPYGTEPIEKRIVAARMQRDDLDSDNKKEEDDLESLMDKMGKFYSRNICQDPRRILPAVGELCVAKYSKDNKWCRARITSVREEELLVFFVDYGNSEWTRESNVKRILPHFLHLPFQALECFLGNVEPSRDSQQNGRKVEWSDVAMKTFKALTEDKVLIAHILSKAWNQTIYVDLWDTEGDEIHINKVLINKGFGQETNRTVNNPWNIEGTITSNPDKMVGLPG
ncbi:uncharacterized protein [Montipora capricornis]|uniref:uncharacterized protein isoform X2 n=1 Tax=Montipora capricornis TaxID=246305 RepID=UPI0035F183C1